MIKHIGFLIGGMIMVVNDRRRHGRLSRRAFDRSDLVTCVDTGL